MAKKAKIENTPFGRARKVGTLKPNAEADEATLAKFLAALVMTRSKHGREEIARYIAEIIADHWPDKASNRHDVMELVDIKPRKARKSK